MHALATITKLNGPDIDEQVIVDQALEILERRGRSPGHFINCPADATAYVRLKLAEDPDREHFLVVYLDNRHGVIAGEVLFHVTINGASVHPRVILQRALALNAAAVLLAHNHPSGNAQPSPEDHRLTQQIKDVLAMVDIQTLDHLVVSEGPATYSFAENGRI